MEAKCMAEPSDVSTVVAWGEASASDLSEQAGLEVKSVVAGARLRVASDVEAAIGNSTLASGSQLAEQAGTAVHDALTGARSAVSRGAGVLSDWSENSTLANSSELVGQVEPAVWDALASAKRIIPLSMELSSGQVGSEALVAEAIEAGRQAVSDKSRLAG